MQQVENKYEGRVLVDLPGLSGARKRRRLSQRGLAEMAGVGFVTINRIEKGRQRANIDTAKKLARAMRTDLNELVFPQEERSE